MPFSMAPEALRYFKRFCPPPSPQEFAGNGLAFLIHDTAQTLTRAALGSKLHLTSSSPVLNPFPSSPLSSQRSGQSVGKVVLGVSDRDAGSGSK
jgi:hypothetical protein